MSLSPSASSFLPRLAFAVMFASWWPHAAAAPSACDDDLPDPMAVQVVQPTIQVTRTEGGAMLTVLGTFRNTSPARAANLVVEATLTDAQGKVVDVLTQPVYGVPVPAGREVAFRVQGGAAAAPGAYAGVRARVVAGASCQALAAPARHPEKSPWLDLLISWAPMIVLILAWMLVMRKYSGKGSNQAKALEAMIEQNALLARQSAALEAIAAATASPRGDAA